VPLACRSPSIESFQPENGNHATGAATPTFTPSIPASAPQRYERAAAPEVVKIDPALP
jgi:hypothetical protein